MSVRMWGKQNPHTLLVECKLMQPLWKQRFLKKLNIELPYDPAIPLLGMKVKVLIAQSYLPPCSPIDCSPPGSSVHGILQARILEWVAMSFSRGSSWPRDWTQVSHITSRFFPVWATGEAPFLGIYSKDKKTLIWKDTCSPMFIAAILKLAKVWEQPKCPSTDEWIKKMFFAYTLTHTHTYTHNGILLLLLLSHFSRVRLCVTPSLGFFRQEHWSGWPFPSPMHKSEKWKVKVKSLSHVQLFVTPWTVAYQAPPFTGFSRQEYWSGVLLPSPMKYYSAIKKNKSLPYAASWMDLKGFMLSETSQTEKYKYGLVSAMCGI